MVVSQTIEKITTLVLEAVVQSFHTKVSCLAVLETPIARSQLTLPEGAVLENENHHLLVFDGGTAKFNFEWDGEAVEVLDLSECEFYPLPYFQMVYSQHLDPYTVAIDLAVEFDPRTFLPLWQVRKSVDIPVLNRFGIWTDSTQDFIYIQGGHFYEAPKWNESQYFIKKEDIPDYSIWRFNVRTKEWSNVTGEHDTKRACAGAAISVPKQNQSYYLG